MARIRTYNVTLGTGATRVTTTHTPVLEVHITNTNTGAGHTVTVGGSDVATVPGLTVPIGTTDTPAERVLGQGPSGAAAFNLEDLYLKGTQNDVIQVLAITL